MGITRLRQSTAEAAASAVRNRSARTRLSAPLCSTRGEGYIDTAIKILIAVVLGALLLAGLYTLFGDTVLPTVTERVEEMFDYNG